MFLFVIILILASMLAFAVSLCVNAKSRVLKRKMRKWQPKQINSCTEGETVKIVGKVKIVGEPLIAPLSGRKCAYYRVRVEEVRGKALVPTRDHSGCSFFIVTDGAGYARLEHKQVSRYLLEDKKYRSGLFKRAVPEMEHFLAKHLSTYQKGRDSRKSIRCREAIVQEGDTVAILGKTKWEKWDMAGDMPLKGSILSVYSDGQEPVYFSNHPKLMRQATSQPG